ncbi:MAG: hypothetical protein ACODAQ_07820 [Phycisphaeraceae bacterium]
MARTRSTGGGGASAWALVIFALGFGICLIISVYLYTQVTAARQASDEARTELSRYVSSSQQSLPEVRSLLEQAEQEDTTVLEQMLESNRSLRGVLVADREASFSSIQDRVAALSNESSAIEPPVISALEDLLAELRAEQDRLARLEDQLSDAQQRASAAEQEKERLNERFQEAQQTLQQRLDTATSEFASYESQVGEMESQLTQRVEEVHSAREERIVELENEVRERQQRINTLQQRLADLRNEMKGIQAPDVVQADGQIAAVIQNDDKVYINLGRRDHLVLGMTFEVFDAGVLIKPDEYEEVRGKATIEVIEIQPESALARIVREDERRRGSGIAENDQIVNVAFDPDAIFTFHVHGKFDIRGTGNPTSTDTQRVESIVRRWGGELAEELSYDVDFVVLGNEPELPGQLPEGTIDPAEIRAHAEAQREYEQYQELIGEAQSRNIPILNQNRFLALVGYYER